MHVYTIERNSILVVPVRFSPSLSKIPFSSLRKTDERTENTRLQIRIFAAITDGLPSRQPCNCSRMQSLSPCSCRRRSDGTGWRECGNPATKTELRQPTRTSSCSSYCGAAIELDLFATDFCTFLPAATAPHK